MPIQSSHAVRPGPAKQAPAAHSEIGAPSQGGTLMTKRIAEIEQALQARGILTGRPERISARIDSGLLAAAAEMAGSSNTTDILRAALAAFITPDPFVTWFLSDRDLLPPDFELAI
jgi:hypothetical protein